MAAHTAPACCQRLNLVSPILYFLGTVWLLPGTALLLPRYADHYLAAIESLIVACSLLTAAALWDLVKACCCSPAPPAAELPGPGDEDDAGFVAHKDGDAEEPLLPEDPSLAPCCTPPALWCPVMMLLGGSLFLLASVLWLPRFDSTKLLGHGLAVWGTSVFRTGSCAYLSGSFASLPGCHAAVRRAAAAGRGLGSAVAITAGVYAYIAGALLYIAGGIVSQAHAEGFAQIWITGSACFVLGATLFLAVA
eukprot:TRINITY_DN70514_c0_g1_i1.p1 TRINITY_DN70514_c0_g1~~TRINITY_DN70514_c0_g1_i1.p1  ORF type:complete len:283 (+),score=87.47 TRINITY_DN70514_c0_g1_i1:101-850(+)